MLDHVHTAATAYTRAMLRSGLNDRRRDIFGNDDSDSDSSSDWSGSDSDTTTTEAAAGRAAVRQQQQQLRPATAPPSSLPPPVPRRSATLSAAMQARRDGLANLLPAHRPQQPALRPPPEDTSSEDEEVAPHVSATSSSSSDDEVPDDDDNISSEAQDDQNLYDFFVSEFETRLPAGFEADRDLVIQTARLIRIAQNRHGVASHTTAVITDHLIKAFLADNPPAAITQAPPRAAAVTAAADTDAEIFDLYHDFMSRHGSDRMYSVALLPNGVDEIVEAARIVHQIVNERYDGDEDAAAPLVDAVIDDLFARMLPPTPPPPKEHTSRSEESAIYLALLVFAV